MELTDFDTFLVLTEELHFGRTAVRMSVSPARVSQRIRAFEHRIGGSLFDRSGRQVRLTALGSRVRDELGALCRELRSTLEEARQAVAAANGIRVGYTTTATGEPLRRLMRAFESAGPDSGVGLQEIAGDEPLVALSTGRVDVLVGWSVVAVPGVVVGPALDRQSWALAVAADHPLACRESVSVEVLADYPVLCWGAESVVNLRGGTVVPTTPAGRPIVLTRAAVRSAAGIGVVLANGRAVLPVVASAIGILDQEDIALVPMHDVPQARLSLMWLAGRESARLRQFVDRAATMAWPDPASAVAGPRTHIAC